jgi:hypothetical protein
MKNKIINKIILSAMAVYITAMPVFAKTLSHPELKFVIKKFGVAMIGVMLFSFMLYLGLALYNKFFVSEQIKEFKLRKDSLRTPSDKDEAIMMFIAKNKLK